MPTYQYECEACKHSFDNFQSMTAAKLVKCPECGKDKLYRLIGTGGGVIFKGSGFYETDYKRKVPAKAAPKKDKVPQAEACSGCQHSKKCADKST